MFQKIARTAARAVLSTIGAAKGYGRCMHCKNTWDVVQGKHIPFRPGRGMFPVCIECFDILTADQIIHYANQLVDEWVKQNYPPTDSEAVKRAAAASILSMKEKQAA